jgi:hypothetical protein
MMCYYLNVHFQGQKVKYYILWYLNSVVRIQSQSYVCSPSERSGVSMDSWRNKHAASAGSLSKTLSLCPYLSTVHDFIPFSALSDMHFHALDAILCPCLKACLSFPILICATVRYKYSLKNCEFVSTQLETLNCLQYITSCYQLIKHPSSTTCGQVQVELLESFFAHWDELKNMVYSIRWYNTSVGGKPDLIPGEGLAPFCLHISKGNSMCIST